LSVFAVAFTGLTGRAEGKTVFLGVFGARIPFALSGFDFVAS
jgi:hypothetical protein